MANISNEWELEETLCETAVVFPENFDFKNSNAGLAATLGLHIIELSGFGDPSHPMGYLEASTKKMEMFESQAEVVINAAFPHITFENMENWTIQELMDYLAKAQWKLSNFFGMPFVMEFPEPQEPKAMTDQEIKKLKEEIISHGGDPMIDLPPQHVLKQRPKIQIPTKFIGGRNWRSVKE